VSSVGINRTKILPSSDTCDHVRYFRQALALDECRVKFLPEYACRGMSDRQQSQFVPLPEEDLEEIHVKERVKVKEVWFAGDHSIMYVPLAREGLF